MKFNTNTNDSLTLGYTNLKLENYNDIHDLRISYNIPKWIIGGDLKIDLERQFAQNKVKKHPLSAQIMGTQ